MGSKDRYVLFPPKKKIGAFWKLSLTLKIARSHQFQRRALVYRLCIMPATCQNLTPVADSTGLYTKSLSRLETEKRVYDTGTLEHTQTHSTKNGTELILLSRSNQWDK